MVPGVLGLQVGSSGWACIKDRLGFIHRTRLLDVGIIYVLSASYPTRNRATSISHGRTWLSSASRMHVRGPALPPSLTSRSSCSRIYSHPQASALSHELASSFKLDPRASSEAQPLVSKYVS